MYPLECEQLSSLFIFLSGVLRRGLSQKQTFPDTIAGRSIELPGRMHFHSYFFVSPENITLSIASTNNSACCNDQSAISKSTFFS